ncbi:hypothetical protein LTR50_001172 [Elasticomyces elasticus]|nr:hypothetical protein LTR50_001172 [Elasticomyces elasticus]
MEVPMRNLYPSTMDKYLTQADKVVLQNLAREPLCQAASTISESNTSSTTVPNVTADEKNALPASNDNTDIECIRALNDEMSPDFQPTVFTTWDEKDLPPALRNYLIKPYVRFARHVVRRPTDVVFLTHILTYLAVSVPSACWLFYRFTWYHGICHLVWTGYCCGPFTLMLHNHIHNNGVLSKKFALIDRAFPYILEPLMGHTWDSYYYHHVKHHHVEGNGPDDLSSTVRYQRDELVDFLHYVGRFMLFVWVELPLYFIRKRKYKLALKSGITELFNYACIYMLATRVDFRATLFAVILPLILMRIGMMVGNWGQHALVDEVEPDSDFRSSITLVDVASNRFCFNDGYHTAHHLNPRRHWRDQPLHFLQAKEQYRDGRALIFQNIDYIMMTVKLIQKDYMHLAGCLVPIGEQVHMSKKEIAEMLRTKTKRFSEEDIAKKFGKPVVCVVDEKE